MTRPQLRCGVDLLLALVVGGLTLASSRVPELGERHPGQMGPRHGGPRQPEPSLPPLNWSLVGITLVLVTGLALRRSRPRTSYAVVVAAVTAFLLAGGHYGPVLLAPALVVQTLTTRLPLRQWVPLTLALPLMLSAGFWTQPYAGLTDPGLYAVVVLGTAGIVLPGLVTLVLVARHDAELQDRAADRRRAAYEERLRIAREVHDVVGHSLAVINMQAGVALHVLEKRPEQMGRSLEAIRTTSKTALAELSSTLATLRAEPLHGGRPPGSGDPFAGSPGLVTLTGLVAALQAAGRSVRFEHPARGWAPVSPAVEHAALRIAQEGLTNVVRHASPEASITVALVRRGPVLVVEVIDDGEPTADEGFVEGSGIAGIRERARTVGGSVSVGPRPEGGFAVHAELPVDGRRPRR
ncbi:MAG: sensor histidine kinase [Friedmanniella sp.]|jgi:signal transduction histidine kinase